MKSSKAQIDSFLSQPHIAVAGYSRDKKKFGNQVYETLKQKGLRVYPVNPAGGINDAGEKIYTDVRALPSEVKALYVVTKPTVSEPVIREAQEAGFTHFWVQQMSENAEVLALLGNAPHAVTKQCILLHANPAGFHKFHRWLAGLFGMLPR